MIQAEFNYLAILVAAIAGIAVGFVWYAPPVFGKRWQKDTGVTPPGIQAQVIWAVCFLLVSFTLAYLYRHLGVSTLEGGFRWGSTLGATLVAASVAPNYAFARKPWSLFLIEMGYVFVAITVMGVILGVWR